MFILFGQLAFGDLNPIKYEIDASLLDVLEVDKFTAKGHDVRRLIDDELSHVTHLVEIKNPLPFLSVLQLPICDGNSPPIGWKYVKANDSFYYLQYLNNKIGGDHFFVWEKGNWVRLFHSEGKSNKEGMYCFISGDYLPTVSKFIQIELNRNVFTQVAEKQKVVAVLQNTILQMSATVKNKVSLVTGSLTLSTVPTLAANKLVLELWQKKQNKWELLNNAVVTLSANNNSKVKLMVVGKSSFNSEIKMLLKLDDQSAANFNNLDFLVTLFIYEASIMLRS